MTELECREIFAKLSEYLDRELPDDLCQKIAAHIDECPPCVEFVASLRKSVDLCRRLRADAPSRPLSDEIMDRLLDSYRSSIEK